MYLQNKEPARSQELCQGACRFCKLKPADGHAEGLGKVVVTIQTKYNTNKECQSCKVIVQNMGFSPNLGR
jgi:hypothetical protein